jgi:hypothetical protein
MARTALNPYQLPNDYAGVGSEILDQYVARYGGPYYTGIGANSLYRNYRGDLVHDNRGSNDSALQVAPVLSSASETAQYKPRILGRSSFTSETVVVRFYVDCELTTGPGQITFNCLVGSSATTASVAITATTAGWVELFFAGPNPVTITDTTETEEFDCSFTVDSGTWAHNRVEVVHIYYPVDATALPVPGAGLDGYAQSGFVPFDDGQFAGERPRSTAQLHHLARDLWYLDRKRVGNICTAGNMYQTPNTIQYSTIFEKWVPPGVVSAKFQLKTVAGATVNITTRGIGAGSASSAAVNPTTWTALQVTVEPETVVAFLIQTSNSATQFLKDISGYWEDI